MCTCVAWLADACVGPALPWLSATSACPCWQATEAAIAELQLNGCSRAEAVAVLAACGGSAQASLDWLLQRRQQEDALGGEAAVAELAANGLSRQDAEAALRESGSDVDQVG